MLRDKNVSAKAVKPCTEEHSDSRGTECCSIVLEHSIGTQGQSCPLEEQLQFAHSFIIFPHSFLCFGIYIYTLPHSRSLLKVTQFKIRDTFGKKSTHSRNLFPNTPIFFTITFAQYNQLQLAAQIQGTRSPTKGRRFYLKIFRLCQVSKEYVSFIHKPPKNYAIHLMHTIRLLACVSQTAQLGTFLIGYGAGIQYNIYEKAIWDTQSCCFVYQSIFEKQMALLLIMHLPDQEYSHFLDQGPHFRMLLMSGPTKVM